MTQLYSPSCYTRKCKHYQGVVAEDMLHQYNYCEAFPNGIPYEIAYGDNVHDVPLSDQGNDIVYEAKPRGVNESRIS
jgi:hypothetical protein